MQLGGLLSYSNTCMYNNGKQIQVFFNFGHFLISDLFHREEELLQVLKFLLDHDADVLAISTSGWAVLHFAAESSALDIVKYLVEEKKVGKNICLFFIGCFWGRYRVYQIFRYAKLDCGLILGLKQYCLSCPKKYCSL